MDDIWFLTLFDILIRLCVGGGQGALWGVWEDATGWPRKGQQSGQEKGATPGQYVVLSLSMLSSVSVFCSQCHVLSLSVMSSVSVYCPQCHVLSLSVLSSVSVLCPQSYMYHRNLSQISLLSSVLVYRPSCYNKALLQVSVLSSVLDRGLSQVSLLSQILINVGVSLWSIYCPYS